MQILDSGGSVLIECRLSIGQFEEKASKTLRVRMEHKSLASAPSEGEWKNTYKIIKYAVINSESHELDIKYHVFVQQSVFLLPLYMNYDINLFQ